MSEAAQMPLQEVLQALSRTPVTQPQLRAALATTCARWHLLRGEETEAIRHLGHALEMVPDLRPAMRLLYRIYLDRGDIRSAVMYLDQEIRATRHPREAAALYRERGLLVEAHFHDLGAAGQCYQAALKATPRDLAVLRSVERVCLARGEVFWLIANLESQLEVLQDETTVSGVLHDLALLEARHKGDLRLGGDLLLAALERLPGHLLLASDMFRLAEVAGDAELMLIALQTEAEALPPARRAVPLARASVTLREHRERPAALALLDAAARAQPKNISLWRSLEELASATSAHDTAAHACIGQLEAMGDEEDPGARAELYYRLGRLCLFRLDRPVDGLAAMRRALRLNPTHVLVLEDTGRFLNAGGMWSQHLELVKLEIASASEAGLTSRELALCHLRAGQVLEERLGELEGARKYYEDAISADARFRPPRDRLERLLHRIGDTEGLRAFYTAELSAAQTAARRTSLLSILGQLHSEDDDPEAAIKYLVNLLKQTPDHLSSLQLLARLLAKAGRSKDLFRVTRQEIELTKSPTRKARLLHRAGELALELGDRTQARECFERALECVDDHLPSLESLGKLLRQDGDWPALVELLRKDLLYANDRARQAGLRLEIATLLSTKLERKEEALKELQSLLERWPRHLPALHAAEALAAALGHKALLIELLEQHVAAVSGPRTRALLLHRVASLRTAEEDYEGAVRDLVRALELWPQLGVARARLLRLYEALGRSRELQAFAEAGLTSERGADDRRAMALQLAELSPKPVVALQYLGAVAEARPEDYVTQLRLALACQEAHRPSRAAGAFLAAADQFAQQAEPGDASLLATRYLAGRAYESGGNLEAADDVYASILDADPEHLLAQRGRRRIRERQRRTATQRSSEDLDAAVAATGDPVEKAAYLTMSGELHERQHELKAALGRIDRALEFSSDYVPALHARARILERMGSEDALDAAIDTLRKLASLLHGANHRADVLCRAGTLALRAGSPEKPNPRAWSMFCEALRLDPRSERAVRGLRRTLDGHGTSGSRPVAESILARVRVLHEDEELTPNRLRELVFLAAEIDGPDATVSLLERSMDLVDDDAGLHADLAQAYARLDRWSDAVRALDAAMSREMSPERRAGLHYFAGEANERAGNLSAAVEHFLAAGKAGFHAKHSLLAAERLAEEADALEHRVTALQMLVDVTDGPDRARSLRALAEIHRGPRGEPDVAVELMRELLLLRPTDLDVLAELRRLLEALGRPEEAVAAALAGIAHHRAWLRSADHEGSENELGAAVGGLLRLFESLGENNGVYVGACILELLSPGHLPRRRRPDDLLAEPWPLPRPQEGRPFDGLVGDLPDSAAFDLLREGVPTLGMLPGPEPDLDLSPSRSLPTNSAVVMVVRALAGAMGVPQPLVFLDPNADGVIAHIGAVPCLLVDRRISNTPAGPRARDAIGRALLRLSTGGDALHQHATPEQRTALLFALCTGAGVELDVPRGFDWDYANAVEAAIPPPDALEDLREAALAFQASAEVFDPSVLAQTLQMAEDRAGAICAADPRPSLRRVIKSKNPTRLRMLTGYLLSDDHLTLRETLGYHIELAARRTTEASA